METTSIRAEEITRNWYIIDAEDQILGRLASTVAQILRGKNKPYFTPHMDMGDFVVIINADKIKLTGNKEVAKTYFSHSGYPGGTKETNLKKVRKQHPERIIINAVQGMLPHNRLGRRLLKHLKVYTTEIHPHKAQQPKLISI